MEQPMSYEEMLQMLQLGGQTSDIDAQMAQQTARAKMLREGRGLEPRQAGRVVVAPHVVELMGQIAKQYMAGKADKEAAALGKQKTANQQQQYEMLLRALMANRGAGAQPAQGLQLPSGPAMGMSAAGMGGMGMKPPVGY